MPPLGSRLLIFLSSGDARSRGYRGLVDSLGVHRTARWVLSSLGSHERLFVLMGLLVSERTTTRGSGAAPLLLFFFKDFVFV